MSSNQESTDDIVLRAESLTAGYVGQPVVRELNITVRKGEVVCLLGPNGAGKTTTLMTLTGMLPLMSGTIEMFGRVGQEPLYKRAKSGLSFVTEERSIAISRRQRAARWRSSGEGHRSFPGAQDQNFDPSRAPLRWRAADADSGKGVSTSASTASR